MVAQCNLKCVEKLKTMLPVMVGVAKTKMTSFLGSIAIPMFAAMVTSPKSECAEDYFNFGDSFVTSISALS